MLAQPQQLRRREAGQRAVAGQLDEPLEADALLDLAALRRRALVVPEDRRADHLAGRVERDEAVHLAAQPDPGDVAHAERRRAPPPSPATSPPGPARPSPAAASRARSRPRRAPAPRPYSETASALTPLVPTSRPTATLIARRAGPRRRAGPAARCRSRAARERVEPVDLGLQRLGVVAADRRLAQLRHGGRRQRLLHVGVGVEALRRAPPARGRSPCSRARTPTRPRRPRSGRRARRSAAARRSPRARAAARGGRPP